MGLQLKEFKQKWGLRNLSGDDLKKDVLMIIASNLSDHQEKLIIASGSTELDIKELLKHINLLKDFIFEFRGIEENEVDVKEETEKENQDYLLEEFVFLKMIQSPFLNKEVRDEYITRWKSDVENVAFRDEIIKELFMNYTNFGFISKIFNSEEVDYLMDIMTK